MFTASRNERFYHVLVRPRWPWGHVGRVNLEFRVPTVFAHPKKTVMNVILEAQDGCVLDGESFRTTFSRACVGRILARKFKKEARRALGMHHSGEKGRR